MKKGIRWTKVGIVLCVCAFTAALFALAACAPAQSSSSDQSASQESSSAVSESSSAQSSESSASEASESSSAPQKIVPNVVSLSLDDAKKTIKDSGLKLGTVKNKASDSVQVGHVISQTPTAGKPAGVSGRVSLTVSTGKPEVQTVAVPDIRGMTKDQAENALEAVGLVGVYDGEVESTQMSPGLVLRQSIDPGQSVGEGTRVSYAIAKPPAKVSVPNVVGKTAENALATAQAASLQFKTTSEYSDNVAKGVVIRQSPSAETVVAGGSTLTAVVSLGKKSQPKPQGKVPDVVGMSIDQAADAINKAGLALDATSKYSSDVPKDYIISQKPAAGKKVSSGSTVRVVVSMGEKPVPMTTVPDLIGYTWPEAKEILKGIGLKPDRIGNAKGQVVDQDISAGTEVERGTYVTVTLEMPVQKVEVPDIVGMSANSAYDAITSAGLSTDSSWQEHGVVVSQKPKAGKMVDEGTVVSVEIDTSEFE